MSSPVTTIDAGHGDHGHGHDAGGNTVLGFWIYLMSDCLIFAILFATFGVLASSYAGGPTGKELFDLPYVAGETLILLVSSFTFGVAMLNMAARKTESVISWLLATFLLGTGFIWMEVREFTHLIAEHAGPDRSAFLSAYFTLVGTHGLHVTAGLLWLVTMMHQVARYGLDGIVRRRLACLSLFWHFLDLVWICVFTFVYLRGVL
ncbi:cytochrome o ubiquinol oxidase subunit III [Sphingomonas oligoaromativorans]|jgi:cytochrome o ubiquinol oxidase subunit 3|uniref:cytochrome o ubiquinol oxidase subunit III n=1 Tax=Sphingomonas oligoaromativorans TaxID=575322 RepID=UPI001422488E|nr:cytochrome o ubiquinol oxidase subunit III [Sphingomonas oligoaromativorans]NIJ34243.1 cytochrome o ubiquinol oxidase subunit 3 [Sphingomonas oligoaromativorans]